MPECPYKKECATVLYWSEERADFIKEVCDTDGYRKCIHYTYSLKPQHDERQRLYGNPHANEPNWNKGVSNNDG